MNQNGKINTNIVKKLYFYSNTVTKSLKINIYVREMIRKQRCNKREMKSG